MMKSTCARSNKQGRATPGQQAARSHEPKEDYTTHYNLCSSSVHFGNSFLVLFVFTHHDFNAESMSSFTARKNKKPEEERFQLRLGWCSHPRPGPDPLNPQAQVLLDHNPTSKSLTSQHDAAPGGNRTHPGFGRVGDKKRKEKKTGLSTNNPITRTPCPPHPPPPPPSLHDSLFHTPLSPSSTRAGLAIGNICTDSRTVPASALGISCHVAGTIPRVIRIRRLRRSAWCAVLGVDACSTA